MKIEGYFSNIKTANEAADKLKSLGLGKVIVDMNDHYNEDRNVQTNLPGTETSASLTGLVLESDSNGAAGNKAPLNAASPMVSGIGTFDEIADINCKVIVESGEEDADKVKQAILDMGGDLESPNIRKPKVERDEEITVRNALSMNRKFLEQEEDRI